MSTDKSKVILSTIERLEKQYGKGIVMRLGDKPKIAIDSFPTGSLMLDASLGIGGFPRGRVIEVYGPEASGKTTIALHAIAEMQKKGGQCAFVDAEHALDPIYARRIGIDLTNFYVSQPNDGEQALEVVDQLILSSGIDLIVIDSVAALVPRAEIDGNMGDPQVALQARLMSQAMRKITGSLSKTSTTIIFINQLRSKVGVIFGNPETTTGGNALKFYSTVRLEVRRSEQIKKGEENIGCKVKIKVVKNKVAPPFRVAETTLIYGKGISKLHEIIDLGVKFDILKKAGSWYSYNDERLAQGVENLRNILAGDKKLADELEAKVREKVKEANEIILGDDKKSTEESKKTSEPNKKAPSSLASKQKEKKTEIDKLDEASKKMML